MLIHVKADERQTWWAEKHLDIFPNKRWMSYKKRIGFHLRFHRGRKRQEVFLYWAVSDWFLIFDVKMNWSSWLDPASSHCYNLTGWWDDFLWAGMQLYEYKDMQIIFCDWECASVYRFTQYPYWCCLSNGSTRSCYECVRWSDEAQRLWREFLWSRREKNKKHSIWSHFWLLMNIMYQAVWPKLIRSQWHLFMWLLSALHSYSPEHQTHQEPWELQGTDQVSIIRLSFSHWHRMLHG